MDKEFGITVNPFDHVCEITAFGRKHQLGLIAAEMHFGFETCC